MLTNLCRNHPNVSNFANFIFLICLPAFGKLLPTSCQNSENLTNSENITVKHINIFPICKMWPNICICFSRWRAIFLKILTLPLLCSPGRGLSSTVREVHAEHARRRRLEAEAVRRRRVRRPQGPDLDRGSAPCCRSGLVRSDQHLRRARSRLYRSEISQVNMRLKALAEIYTIHSFAPFLESKFEKPRKKEPLSNLKIVVKFSAKKW